MQALRGAASPYLRPGRGPLQRPAPTADSRSPFLVQWPVVTQLSRGAPRAATRPPRRVPGRRPRPSLSDRARCRLVAHSSRSNSLLDGRRALPHPRRRLVPTRLPHGTTCPDPVHRGTISSRPPAGPSRPDPTPRGTTSRSPAGPRRLEPSPPGIAWSRLDSPGTTSSRPDSPAGLFAQSRRTRSNPRHAPQLLVARAPQPPAPAATPVAPLTAISTSTTPAPSYESLSRPMHAELAPAPVRATSGVWSSCQRVPPIRPRPARAERHPAATSYVQRTARRPRVGRRSAVLQTDSVEHAPGPPLRVGPRPGRRRDGPGVRAAAVRAPRPLVIHPLARGAFGHLLAGAPLMCLCAIHRHMNRRPGCAWRSTAPDAPGAITHAFQPLACLAFHVEQSPSNRRERASVPRRSLPSPVHVRCVDPQRAAKVTQRPGPGLVPPGLTRVSARSDQTHS